MMLLNVGGPISTIQLIISVIPIDVIDRSGAGLVREHEGIRACMAVPILNQPTEPIGFTFFIC
jgi:hypothetical protein